MKLTIEIFFFQNQHYFLLSLPYLKLALLSYYILMLNGCFYVFFVCLLWQNMTYSYAVLIKQSRSYCATFTGITIT